MKVWIALIMIYLNYLVLAIQSLLGPSEKTETYEERYLFEPWQVSANILISPDTREKNFHTGTWESFKLLEWESLS